MEYAYVRIILKWLILLPEQAHDSQHNQSINFKCWSFNICFWY